MTPQEMERVKRTVIRKYPIFASIALLNVPIEADKNISTAAVWAEKDEKEKLVLKGIKYNPDFFDNLSFEQQVFVMAHETCHIAFKHFSRSLDKPEKDVLKKYQEFCENNTDERLRNIEMMRLQNKYYKFWNIATDACINAFLIKDGLEMPEGIIDKRTGQPMKFVNIADGLYRRAEVIYDSLVQKDEEKNKQKQENREEPTKDNSQENKSNNNQQSSGSSEVGGGIDDIDIDNYQGIDSHEEWTKDINQKKETTSEQQSKKEKDSQSLLDKIKDMLGIEGKDKNKSKEEKKDTNLETNPKKESDSMEEIDETKIFDQNSKKLEEKNNKSLNEALNSITKESIGEIKIVKPVLSWKHLLIRSIEEEVEQWGYRRASRSMPNARIEDRTQEERSITEIVLDTSGSVSDELLKNFLFQLFPLFRETEIKVGCFAGKFYGFTEIKTTEAIKKFRPIRDNDGTNYEAAATAFTKNNGNRRINKIVFTDGELDNYAPHNQKTKVDGILWIVFGNKMNFHPVSGKIIRVSTREFEEMNSITNNNIQTLEENSSKRRR